MNQARPSTKRSRFSLFKKIALAVATIVIAAASFFFVNRTQKTTSPKQTTNTIIDNNTPKKSSVAPPFETVEITPEQLIIDNPSKANTLTTKSGNTIAIPANAFVNKTGETISTPVKIEYKEYESAAEIIASGIPMYVKNSNGESGWMQSAGMFDINGYSNNEAVEIAPDKTLEVNYVSNIEGDYDAWRLDEDKGDWVNIGATTSEPINDNTTVTEVQEETRVETRAIALRSHGGSTSLQGSDGNMYYSTITRPVKAFSNIDKSNKLVFTDLDISQCPKVKKQKEIAVVYAGKNSQEAPKNNAWINQSKWHKKILSPTKEKDIYKLSLYGNKMYSIPVQVIPDPITMERMNADYQKALAVYNRNLLSQQAATQTAAANNANTFNRKISIPQFAIYNYDFLLKNKDNIPLLADFNFENATDDLRKATTIYLVTKGDKAVIRLPKKDWNKFRFNPKDDNKLIAVLPENKAAIFKQSSFKKEKKSMIASKGKNYVFELESREESVESLEDLEGLLTIASK